MILSLTILPLRPNRPSSDSVADEVARLVRADAVQLLGPIRQELLYGVRPSERLEQLKAYLRFYPLSAIKGSAASACRRS